MKVMAGGFRSHKPGDPTRGKLARPGAMLAALKWVVKNPNVATTIPSITDMDQLDENLKAMAAAYSPADAEDPRRAPRADSPALLPHVRRSATAHAEKGLPVADVLRCLTYADGYGQFALGRERYLELAATRAAFAAPIAPPAR